MRRNILGYSQNRFISVGLDVWLCLKKGFENMVLVSLLQRGAKDLTVVLVRKNTRQSQGLLDTAFSRFGGY